MSNSIGFIASLLYIAVILGSASLLAKYTGITTEGSRKYIHILLGNWVFFSPLFTSWWALATIPALFVVINSISKKHQLLPAMERGDDSYGTVFYAASLLLLSLLSSVFKNPRPLYLGVLIMAYGDGLAAVIGQKFGNQRQLPEASSKTVAGSLTLGVTSFLVTSLVLQLIIPTGLNHPSMLLTLLIALLGAVFSVAVERTGTRGIDNLSLPLASAYFVELLLLDATPGLFAYLAISLLLLVVAYRKQALQADAIWVALLVALTLYTLGSPWLAYSLLLFFVLGTIVSKLTNETKRQAESRQEAGSARSWQQVLANSLPAVIALWLASLGGGSTPLYFLSFCVFSAAAADTFSSEIGMLGHGPVYHILTARRIPSGVSGGVSILGLLAGILGSALLALMAIPEFGAKGFWLATVFGISGSLIDSVLGATLQRKYRNERNELLDRAEHNGDKPVSGFRFISNNSVNLITLASVALLAYIVLR